HWNDADHGIWEIRGDPHRYTHSRVMQWAALRAAAAMAQRGLMRGDGETWRRTADDIRAAALPRDGAPLQLHDDGGGADAALSMAVSNGFLRPEDRRAAATLGLIVSRLVRSDLVERYEGSRDGIADRCAPFVFPMFWLATAQRALGGEAGSSAAEFSVDGDGERTYATTGFPSGPVSAKLATLTVAAWLNVMVTG